MARTTVDARRAAPWLAARIGNAAARARNAWIGARPGQRPGWVVLELRGRYPARRLRRRPFRLASLLGGRPEPSQEELEAQVSALLRASWLEGVVVRLGQVQPDLATAFALRNQLARLRSGGKRVVVLANELTTATFYLAAAADEIVVPDGGSPQVTGMAVTHTFMAEALDRLGVRFEKLAIEEFKTAGDNLARSAMSEAHRLQYDALLDDLERSYLEGVGAGRGRPPEVVREWIDRGITSAREAREVGMIDRVAYEDEVLGERHVPYAKAARFLSSRVPPRAPERVAVVSLEGTIVTGSSRRLPVPLPLLGDALAGSETLVRALRTAERDPATAAVVLHVESGGGSALASDLIWRAVQRVAQRKPVVAVMGAVAGSGGYYVLTHATRVLAAPNTVTGSIGVVMGKFVLEDFRARHGINPETLARGRFATLGTSSRGWDEAERELLRRHNQEIYGRFVERVADGRGLSSSRVDELGRGRIWSGRDALGLGLVDELGDVPRAVALARELAGLHPDAPAWNVRAPQDLVLPGRDDTATLVGAWGPLLRERAWLVQAARLQVA